LIKWVKEPPLVHDDHDPKTTPRGSKDGRIIAEAEKKMKEKIRQGDNFLLFCKFPPPQIKNKGTNIFPKKKKNFNNLASIVYEGVPPQHTQKKI
jgi:hypothetical protein